MINRYTLPEMGALWTEEARFRYMLEVEVAACEAMAKLWESGLRQVLLAHLSETNNSPKVVFDGLPCCAPRTSLRNGRKRCAQSFTSRLQ